MRELRLQRGLTCQEVADLTHWSVATITGSEIGIRNAKKGKAFWESMSRFYGVPVEELRRWPE